MVASSKSFLSSLMSSSDRGLTQRRVEADDKQQQLSPMYPVRKGAPDCTFYLQTGKCRLGDACTRNHPPRASIAPRERNEARRPEQCYRRVGDLHLAIDEEQVHRLLNKRADYRYAYDYSRADRIRDELKELGVAVDDREWTWQVQARAEPSGEERKRRRDDEDDTREWKRREPARHGGRHHELTLKKKYIHQIRSGDKTIEGRINGGIVLSYRPNDTVRFFYHAVADDDVVCKIVAMRKYKSFPEMLKAEGYRSCLADARSLDESCATYAAIPGYAERAARSGVVAIEVQVVDRR